MDLQHGKFERKKLKPSLHLRENSGAKYSTPALRVFKLSNVPERCSCSNAIFLNLALGCL